MRPSIRNLLAPIHRWTGLSIGLVVVMIAVTGAVLSMKPQLDRLIYGDLKVSPRCVTPLSIDAVAKAAQNVHAGRIINLRVEPASASSTVVRFDNDDFVFVDPCTGAIRGVQNRWGGIFGTAEQLHKLAYKGFLTSYKVLSSPFNEFATGAVSGVFALVLVVGGLVMWMPRRRSAWRGATRVNTRLRGRPLAMNVHTTIGLYASLIVLTSALTGMSMVFEWPKDVLFAITGSHRVTTTQFKSVVPPGNPERLPLEGFWRAALKIMPPPQSAAIYPGRKLTDPVMIYSIDQGASHAEARNYVRFDAYTGRLLDYTPYAAMSRGMQLYYWGQSIHTGRVGGLVLDLVLLFGALSATFLGYTGFESYFRKTFRRSRPLPATATSLDARVERITQETPTVKVFDLVAADGSDLPAFEPGAHIAVKTGEGRIRHYSLCNGPDETACYRIAVKRDAESRGGSQAMHDTVREGDILSIGLPRSNFPLRAGASHYRLVAAGIGITPILSMAKHLEAAGLSWSMRYYHRPVETCAFCAVLSQLPIREKVTFCQTGDRDRLRREVNETMMRRGPNEHLYMCGPQAFMAMVEEAAAAAAWPKNAVHIEHFKAGAVIQDAAQTPFEIKLARSKKTLHVPAGSSIADVLAANGVDVATSCEQGLCGTCMVEVLDGTPDHRDSFLTPGERKAGDRILICVSRARSASLLLNA